MLYIINIYLNENKTLTWHTFEPVLCLFYALNKVFHLITEETKHLKMHTYIPSISKKYIKRSTHAIHTCLNQASQPSH